MVQAGFPGIEGYNTRVKEELLQVKNNYDKLKVEANSRRREPVNLKCSFKNLN